jgi:penicillin V acylase-like amidase (Ntn superfamily)
MNEAGLVVEVMQLDASEFAQSGFEPSVNESQWVQYMLDNASSVRELKDLATKVRISKILVPLHYMACDHTAACVAIESLNGRLQVSDQIDQGTKVLTNDTYQQSKAFLREFDGFGGQNPAPAGDGSLERFVRAAFFLKSHSSSYAIDPVARGFDGLATVDTPITQWSIVYDILNQRISFKSRSASSIKTLNMKAFDYDCGAPVLFFSVIYDDSEGDVTHLFAPYSHESNAALVRRSLSSDVPEKLIQAAVALPGTTVCER